MNTRKSILLCLLSLAGLCPRLMAQAPAAPPPEVPKAKLPVIIHGDDLQGESPFAPSGWMGVTDAIEYSDSCADNPHSGDTCIAVTFSALSPEWGGIVWQNPPENWGDDDGGLDLSDARQLSFWARGERGGERVEFSMGIIGRDKPYHDTYKAGTGRIRLNKTWRQYTIPLAGKNLKRIITGFSVSFEGDRKPITFYIDDIRYE